jgi:hypothetical protein
MGILLRTAHVIDLWLSPHRGLFLGSASLLCLLTKLGYAHFRVITADERLQMIIVGQPNFRASHRFARPDAVRLVDVK